MQTHLPWTGCGTATAQHESQATHASCWSLSELFFPLLTHKPCSSQDYCTPYLEPRLLTFKVTFRTLLGSTFTPSPHPAPAAPATTCKSYVFPDLQHHHHLLTQQSTGRTGHDHRAYTWIQTLHMGTTQGIPASSQSVFPTHYFLSSFCLNRNFPKKESKK